MHEICLWFIVVHNIYNIYSKITADLLLFIFKECDLNGTVAKVQVGKVWADVWVDNWSGVIWPLWVTIAASSAICNLWKSAGIGEVIKVKSCWASEWP